MIGSSLLAGLIVISLNVHLLLTSGHHFLKRNVFLHFSDVDFLFKHQFSDDLDFFFNYRDNQYTVFFPDLGHRLYGLCFCYMLNLNLIPVKQCTDDLVMLGCGTGNPDMSIHNLLLRQGYFLFSEFKRDLCRVIVFWLPSHIDSPVKIKYLPQLPDTVIKHEHSR